MKILISNDDGILAPGIRALAEALRSVAEIRVVAPDRNRSAASNSLTMSRPLTVTEAGPEFDSVNGTPTDCVHLALTGLFETKPDMVVSGINEGANLGDDVLYSGTVAAAMEGRYLGLPAIALSLVGHMPKHYQTGAQIACQLVERLKSKQLPSQTILNVNIPDLPLEQIKGIEVTRLGARHIAEEVIKETDPRGKPIYWIGPPGNAADAGPGTDFYAVSNGFVSVTPLNLDLTHYPLFDDVVTWMDDINWKP